MRAWRCTAAAVTPGRAAKFVMERVPGPAAAGFVVNHGGRHYAYENLCPHAGTPLDQRSGGFFTEDGRHLACGTHGAIFAPASGVCVEGPCPGARLRPLSIATDGPDLVITWPS